MKKIFLPLVFLFALLLASCSGTAAPAPTTGGDIYVSQNLPVDYEGALAVRNQLALGTLELIQTDSAISAEQAQTLLPLWQALRSTQQAGGTAQAEVSALLTQIEAAMKPEQLQSIASMKLTFTNMQEWATANGITMGSGGGHLVRASVCQQKHAPPNKPPKASPPAAAEAAANFRPH